MLLNDLAWIVLIAPVGMVVASSSRWRFRGVLRRPDRSVFPAGWATSRCSPPRPWFPAGAAVFHTGPLAWDGLLSFWLRNGAFAVFIIVMFFVLRAALTGGGGSRGRRIGRRRRRCSRRRRSEVIRAAMLRRTPTASSPTSG